MIFKNRFQNYILLVSLLTINQTTTASIVEKKCGKTVIQIEIVNSKSDPTEYKMYYMTSIKKKKLFYIPVADSLNVACIKDKANHKLLLMQERCLGSACTDDGVYALFDPNTKAMLVQYKEQEKFKDDKNIDEDPFEGRERYQKERLEDEQKNHEQVTKLIGYTPPFLPESKEAFCCDNR